MPPAQIGARAIASSIGDFVPRGKRVLLNAMTPFSTSVKSRLCSADICPIGTTRVMSVVPPRYWPPESISNKPSPAIVACDAAVAW